VVDKAGAGRYVAMASILGTTPATMVTKSMAMDAIANAELKRVGLAQEVMLRTLTSVRQFVEIRLY
jgi:hypothetical protein